MQHKDRNAPRSASHGKNTVRVATLVDILIHAGCWRCSIGAHEDDASWLVQWQCTLVLQQSHAPCCDLAHDRRVVILNIDIGIRREVVTSGLSSSRCTKYHKATIV